MKLVRGWGKGPSVLPIEPDDQADAVARWQRTIRHAAALASGGHAVDPGLRALMMGTGFPHFRRDMHSRDDRLFEAAR